MKGIGASAAGAVALGSDYGMVDDAEAIAPLVVGGAIAGAAVVGWAVREYEVIGSNPPAEGLTAGALQQDVYETTRTRKSTNASTFVDNRNIINSGLPNTLYAEGKIAAIEALNAEKSQSEVEKAALDAMNKYAATIEKNLLKTWNESVLEFNSLLTAISDHPEVSQSDLVAVPNTDAVVPYPPRYGTNYNSSYVSSLDNLSITENSTATLRDGSTFDRHEVDVSYTIDSDNSSDPTSLTYSYGPDFHNPEYSTYEPDKNDPMVAFDTAAGRSQYLRYKDWNGVWSDLQSTFSNVESGLQTWVTNTYDQVQSGSIDVSELITPRERAEMIAAEDGAAQAIADLAALNIPVDAGNKYTITMADTGATLRGTLAVTDDSQTIESGSTYDPSADTFSGDAFFTYDVATGSGDWSAYEESIDGGVATFTEAPYEKTQYELTTSKNETVTVTRDNFTAVDSSGNPVEPHNSSVAAWEVNLSDQLENDIANLNEVDFFADVDESRMETIKLDSQFTVEKIVNAESDEEVDSASFEKAEPQTDDNYITQTEWDQLQEQNRELIEKYEESQSTGGGGIDLSQFDMFGLPGELVALAGGVVALLIGANK